VEVQAKADDNKDNSFVSVSVGAGLMDVGLNVANDLENNVEDNIKVEIGLNEDDNGSYEDDNKVDAKN